MSSEVLEEKILQFKSKISSCSRIVVLLHSNPDGDAIGAALTIGNTLWDKNLNCSLISPNSFPDFYSFLTGSEKIRIASDCFDQCKELILNADLLIAVDFNSFKRIGDLREIAQGSTAYKVLIDHHVNADESAFDLVFSTTRTSSTCEFLFSILEASFSNSFLTKPIAECIYTGICTDTGSLSYNCNYPSTYEILIKLVEAGIDPEELHQKIYNTYSEKRMRLLGYCLGERLQIVPDLDLAYIFLTVDDLNRFDYQTGDTEGIVNYTLSMSSIQIGVLLSEFSDRIRISFRSKGDINVNEFAKTYYNGGGHVKASGGTSFLSMNETLILLEKNLRSFISKQ